MGAASRKRLAAGLIEISGKPTVVITGLLTDPDIFGADDEWAWEIGGNGLRGRPHPFNMSYSFPLGTRNIPSLRDITEKAKADVKRLVRAAYENVRNGRPSYVGIENQEFQDDLVTHTEEWKRGLDAIARGRPFTPFIDTGEKIIPFPVGHEPSLSGFSAKKALAQKKPQSTAFVQHRTRGWLSSREPQWRSERL
jgi:hypothetical protein